MTQANPACPCGSSKIFSLCCGRFLDSNKKAKTPEQLMRSRFSAFFLGGYGEYLLATWHPDMRGGVSAAELSQKTTDWVELQVVTKAQQGDIGFVEFKAFYRDSVGEIGCHHEKSEFLRVRKHWLYVQGEVQ